MGAVRHDGASAACLTIQPRLGCPRRRGQPPPPNPASTGRTRAKLVDPAKRRGAGPPSIATTTSGGPPQLFRPRGPPFLITALVLLAALYPPRPDTPAGWRAGIQIYGAPVFFLIT